MVRTSHIVRGAGELQCSTPLEHPCVGHTMVSKLQVVSRDVVVQYSLVHPWVGHIMVSRQQVVRGAGAVVQRTAWCMGWAASLHCITVLGCLCGSGECDAF
jgi:hypothetical protein